MKKLVIALAWAFLIGTILVSARPASPTIQNPCVEERDQWVANALLKMQSIKPGMTRAELLRLFHTEGGLSNGLRRTFVSRECPYFKVDVEFKAVGRPDRDAEGRVTVEEDPRDVIVSVSRPYLEYAAAD